MVGIVNWIMKKSRAVTDINATTQSRKGSLFVFTSVANTNEWVNYFFGDPWTPLDASGKSSMVASFTLILFSVFISMPFLARMGGSHENRDIFYESFTNWVSCVFKSFSGTDASWKLACGEYPQERPSLSLLKYNCVALTAHSVVLCPVYLFAYIMSFSYLRLYECIKRNKVQVLQPVATVDRSIDAKEGNEKSFKPAWKNNDDEEGNQRIRGVELVDSSAQTDLFEEPSPIASSD
jgi:hypothetical protein